MARFATSPPDPAECIYVVAEPRIHFGAGRHCAGTLMRPARRRTGNGLRVSDVRGSAISGSIRKNVENRIGPLTLARCSRSSSYRDRLGSGDGLLRDLFVWAAIRLHGRRAKLPSDRFVTSIQFTATASASVRMPSTMTSLCRRSATGRFPKTRPSSRGRIG